MELATDVRWKSPEQLTWQLHASDKKRGWGSDAKSMLQLMLGPVQRASGQALDLLCGSSALQDGLGVAELEREHQTPGTLDLLGGSLQDTTALVELDHDVALPCEWEKCLDLKRGSIYFMNRDAETKSYRGRGKRLLSELYDSSPSSPSGRAFGNDWTPLSSCKKPMIAGDLNSRGLGEFKTEGYSLDLALRLALPDASLCGAREQLPTELALEKSCNCRTTPCISRIPTSSSSSSRSIASYHNSNCIVDMDGPAFSVLEKGEDTDPVPSTMTTVGCSKCFMFVLLSSTDPKCPRCGSCSLLDLRHLNKDGIARSGS